MKNFPIATISVVFLLSLISAPAFTQDAQVRKQIQSQYDAIDKGLKSKNWAAVKPILTPDLTVKSKEGKVSSLKEIEAAYIKLFASVSKITNAKTIVKSLKVNGNQAEVEAVDMFAATLVSPQDKKEHKLVRVGQSKDVWVKSGNTWKLKSSTQTKETTTLDGKPLNQTKPTTPAKTKRI